MRIRLRGVWPVTVGAAFLGGVVVAVMTLLPSMHAVNDGLTCMSTTECSALAAQRSAAAAAWAMAGVAFISMVVGILGVWLVYGTLAATRKSVRVALRGAKAAEDAIAETRRIGEAQVRAYLSPDGMMFDPVSDYVPQFIFRLHNSGQSPAKDLRLQLKLQLGATLKTETFNLYGWLGEIPAQGDGEFRIPVRSTRAHPMWGHNIRMSASLLVNYTDVFGNTEPVPVRYGLEIGTYTAPQEMRRIRPDVEQ